MSRDLNEYPLLDIPMPFQYQLKELDDGDAVAMLNLLKSRTPDSRSMKRKLISGDDRDHDAKRSKANEQTSPNAGLREDIVPTPTVEARLKFELEDENTNIKGSSSREKIQPDNASLPFSNQPLQLSCITGSSGDSPVALPNNSVVTVASQTDEALPLSPIASPSYPPSENSDISQHADFTSNYLSTIASTAHSQLTPDAYKNLIFQLISKMNRSGLSDLGTLIKDNLKRDFIGSLPLEVSIKILTNLGFEDIATCLGVSKSWNKLINSTSYLWRRLMVVEGFLSAEEFKKYCEAVPHNQATSANLEDRFRLSFLENRAYLKNWYSPSYKPHRTTLKGHSTSVVTCLQFEDDYVITGADDKMIRVYDAHNERFVTQLSGHDGGVWALKYDTDGILVSGSTDRSVRVWNIELGKCTHIFRGHTSTVRCLDIIEHQGQKFIVTGSRDHTLHVWKLPSASTNDSSPDECEIYNTTDSNPYFVGVLRGHIGSVRTVSGHGNIVISGSYDHNLMIWDIAKMKCLYVLTGHTDRIYSTIYDHKRNRCISASMDMTIKVWDLDRVQNNGHCSMISSTTNPCIKVTGSMLTLQGHTALVGLLGLSDKFLVSAAADGSLRGWDSNDYSRKFAYHHANLSAITTFYMNDNLLVSGSEGQFNVYNLRTGKLIYSDLLSDADQIWSVKFNNRKLVAAVEKDGKSFVEILDFGKDLRNYQRIDEDSTDIKQTPTSGVQDDVGEHNYHESRSFHFPGPHNNENA